MSKLKTKLKNCPFCNGKVTEHCDEYGGGWISHDEKPKRGSMQKCILTNVNLDTSSRHHFEWNDRPALEENLSFFLDELNISVMDRTKLYKFLTGKD